MVAPPYPAHPRSARGTVVSLDCRDLGSADARSAQVGTGERSEKIRTYNFPERRVTDHRVKLTVHNLEEVLGGALDEQTAALQDAEKRARLEVAT